MPYTACECIADSIACVQPKTRTPGVGCTLRSMTHHLALLPPAGVVRAQWNYVKTDFSNSHVFNLLVIPFPYHIPGSAFYSFSLPATGTRGKASMFGIHQSWIKRTGIDAPGFVVELIKKAQLEVEHLDGVVLPELALDARTYAQIAQRLCEEKDIRVQFPISGVLNVVAPTMGANMLISQYG